MVPNHPLVNHRDSPYRQRPSSSPKVDHVGVPTARVLNHLSILLDELNLASHRRLKIVKQIEKAIHEQMKYIEQIFRIRKFVGHKCRHRTFTVLESF
jgi:hypothetical protein